MPKMVGSVGIEPTTSSVSERRSNQLSYEPMVGEVGFEPTVFTLWERVYSPLLDHRPSSSPDEVASPIGFEPMTRSLEGCCSILLSYGERKW